MISCISDVHIQRGGDERDQLLQKYLFHDLVKGSDHIIFLGDIFDVLVGGRSFRSAEFSETLDIMRSHLIQGKNLYYVEGNHDFHCKDFFLHEGTSFLSFPNFKYIKNKLILDFGQQTIYLSHGDKEELGNPTYKVYRKVIRSLPMGILANHILPASFLYELGEWASANSRKKNQRRYENNISESESVVRARFRDTVESLKKKFPKIDFVLLGHSHVEDIYKSDSGVIYTNNGFAPQTKKFTYIDDNFKPQLISLDSAH